MSLSSYPDICTLVDMKKNGYGDTSIDTVTEIPCLFLQGTSNSRSTNTEVTGADAHVYLDEEHPDVLSRAFRLEGMYVMCDPFGAGEANSWYRISTAKVGQRKLLDNSVDNVHAFLRKVAKPNGVS